MDHARGGDGRPGAERGDPTPLQPRPRRRGVEPPPAVAEFRARLRDADGILLSSPEYVHGVPGALKNAIDWTAGTGEFIGKPVALNNASAAAHHAQESLRETLTTLMARVVVLRIPLRTNRVDFDQIAADPDVAGAPRAVIDRVVALVVAPDA